jgi:hypothetical protein
MQSFDTSFLLHPQAWEEFEALASPEQGSNSPSHVFMLYLQLDTRRKWPLSAFPGSSTGQRPQPLEGTELANVGT